MSPILVRPVREQLEHDRVIRLLQAKYKRKFEVAINPGHQQVAPVGAATSPWYPDLVLHAGVTGKKLVGVVEVETLESINHLEAMSQWAAFSRLRVPFHLYVPTSGVDAAKRLCAEFKISPAEMWVFQAIGEQIRFTLVVRGASRSRAPGAADPKPARASARVRAAAPKARKTPASAPPARKKAAPARRAATQKAARRPAAPKPTKHK